VPAVYSHATFRCVTYNIMKLAYIFQPEIKEQFIGIAISDSHCATADGVGRTRLPLSPS